MIELTSITISKTVAGFCRSKLDGFNSTNSASLLAEFSKEFQIEENKFFKSYITVTLMGLPYLIKQFLNENNNFDIDDNSYQYIDTKFYLKHVSAVMREFGWLPKYKQNIDTPTFQQALDNIKLKNIDSRNALNRIEWVEPTIRDVRLVERSLNWIDLSNPEDEILENIKNVLSEKKTFFEIKKAPVVAMLLHHYMKYKSTLMEEVDFTNSLPIAEVEDSISCECVVVNQKILSKSVLVTLKDQSDNKIIWFNNGSADLEIGDTINLTAKILDHRMYDDICETRIINVRIENIN